MTIEQVNVEAGSKLVSRRLGDLARDDRELIVLAIRKSGGEMRFNPPPELQVSGGDLLIVMGAQASLRRLEAST